MGSWKGRGNQYIQLVKVLYCKLSTNGKQLPAFPTSGRAVNRTPASEVGGESVTTLAPQFTFRWWVVYFNLVIHLGILLCLFEDSYHPDSIKDWYVMMWKQDYSCWNLIVSLGFKAVQLTATKHQIFLRCCLCQQIVKTFLFKKIFRGWN